MMCGAAQSLDQMIIFRLLQGVFGAALSPLSQAIMLDLYPPAKRGSVMAIWGMGVMVGPILGPTLGGYLTESYNWRWVFYVNLPFGIAAVTGMWFFLRDTHRDSTLKFDWTGFAVLGARPRRDAIDAGSRGTSQDWFGSFEIIAEGILGALGLYLFIVHMFTTDHPFIPKEMFKDRNFVSALFLMFVVGVVMLASTALLPPYLQNLANYSVTDTGLLLAPRGLGTMVAMVFAGRLALRIDARYLMATGMMMLLWSMWEMSTWTPDITAWRLIDTTFVQGIGMGLVFVPMNLVAFATLSPLFRTDGSALINLVRNVGSAVGISVTTTVLAYGVQTIHSQMAGHFNAFNRNLMVNAPSLMLNPALPFGAVQADNFINYNAQVQAYANDFLFMFYATLPALAVVFFMKKPVIIQTPGQKIEIEPME